MKFRGRAGSGHCLHWSIGAIITPNLAEVKFSANYVLSQRGGCVHTCARRGQREELTEISLTALHLTGTEDIPLPMPDAISSLIMRKVSCLTWAFHWIIFFSFLPTSRKCCKLPAWISLAWKGVTPCKHTLHHSALPEDCRYIYNRQSWKVPDRRGNEATDMSVCNWIFIIPSPSSCICHWALTQALHWAPTFLFHQPALTGDGKMDHPLGAHTLQSLSIFPCRSHA